MAVKDHCGDQIYIYTQGYGQFSCTRDYLNHVNNPEGIYDDMASDTRWLEANVQLRWRCSDVMILNGYRRTYYFDLQEDLVLFKLTRGDHITR